MHLLIAVESPSSGIRWNEKLLHTRPFRNEKSQRLLGTNNSTFVYVLIGTSGLGACIGLTLYRTIPALQPVTNN